MAGKSSKNNNRGSDLFGYFVSGKDKQYHTNEFAGSFTARGNTATGGVISDYTSGNNVYRAHIFTTSGTFDVTSIGSLGNTVEYLVVAGGGSGGRTQGGYGVGGGGAGGFRTNLAGHPLAGSPLSVSTSPGSYTVTVGGGGAGALGPGDVPGNKGSDSVFGSITSTGGGGGSRNNPAPANCSGGSGGGGYNGNAGGSGNNPPTTPPQGNPGGTAPGTAGAGGGGATGAGAPGGAASGGAGGTGSDIDIVGFTTHYAVGGGGASLSPPHNSPIDPHGVGGMGGQTTAATSGRVSTGGGGGARRADDVGLTGAGGSGVVVVRYRIGTVNTGTAKASGGLISFYNNKTIHTFTRTGTFTAPGSFNETLEYVIIGGGGSGVRNISGGGGAGAYRTGTTPIDNTGPGNPSTVTVQVGGGGVENAVGPVQGGDGTPSYFGTPLTSAGGGGGGYYGKAGNNSPGGSGGGGGTHVSGYPGPGSQAYSGGTSGSYGNDGGAGWYGNGRGGGGGGAGGAGEPGQNTGKGGDGVRIPTTFHNPKSAPTPATPAPTAGGGIGVPGPAGGFYVAGGGGGGTLKGSATGSLAGGAGGYGGGGSAADPFNPLAYGQSGVLNTGSGGSGTNVGPPSGATSYLGGNGGSGIVMVAYPT